MLLINHAPPPKSLNMYLTSTSCMHDCFHPFAFGEHPPQRGWNHVERGKDTNPKPVHPALIFSPKGVCLMTFTTTAQHTPGMLRVFMNSAHCTSLRREGKPELDTHDENCTAGR